jgi:dTDP-4-amino-4,6-dideoxygalactose transaminase
MTSISAAIGHAQLDRLPAFTEARQANAAMLTEGLSDTSVITPTVPANRTHVYHQYTVRVADREAFTDHLSAHDVGYGVYYPTCIHDQPAYDDVEHSAPVAERASREVVSLPVHPNVTDDEIEKIVEVVSNYE